MAIFSYEQPNTSTPTSLSKTIRSLIRRFVAAQRVVWPADRIMVVDEYAIPQDPTGTDDKSDV